MDTILLYSGGLDSLVSAGILAQRYGPQEVTCLFLDYGQHTAQVEYAAAQAALGKWNHPTVTLESRTLVDYWPLVRDCAIVKGNVPNADEDPNLFFVPGRNIWFLLYAAVFGYESGCRNIALSSHRSDHVAGDCMPEFLTALQDAFAWGFSKQRRVENYTIWSPLADYNKAEVVRQGHRMGLPLELTWSCYDSQAHQCGTCHNCVDRIQAFQAAQVPDGTKYLEVRV